MMSTGVKSAMIAYPVYTAKALDNCISLKLKSDPASATCSATVPKVKASTARKPYCTLIRIMVRNRGKNKRPKLFPMGMASSDERPRLTYQAISSHWAMIGPTEAIDKATGKYHWPNLYCNRPEFKYRSKNRAMNTLNGAHGETDA